MQMRRLLGMLIVTTVCWATPTFANPYYTHESFPATGSAATSALMRAELDAITAGFNLLPNLSGNNNQLITINSGGTALVPSGFTFTQTGNITFSGAYNLTLTMTGATTLALPLTGTLATLAGSESFSNKTIVAPVLSGTATGTYTLGGTPTITAPAINGSVTTTGLTMPAFTAGGTISGATGITSVGTIGTGTWNATVIGNTKGGTGQDSSLWSALPAVTAGIWSQYGGTSCTNQFIRSLSASASATCATVGNADLAASAVHTGQLSTSTGVASSGAGAAIDFTLNDYSFFPSLTNTASNPTLVAKNAADPGDTVGRITALAGAGGSSTTARWRYINASFQPTVWVAIDGAGLIQGGWESEDPPSLPGSPIQTGTFTSIQVQLPSDLDAIAGVTYTIDGISYTPDTYLTNRVYASHPEVQNDSARQTRIRRFVIMRGLAQAASQTTLMWLSNRYTVGGGILTLK